MITVRFASGFAIQYNDANYVQRTGDYTDLYEKKDGRWIAQVPTAACVVEVARPCRMYNSVGSSEIIDTFLAMLRDDTSRRNLSAYPAAKIKALLNKHLDSRSKVWR